MNTDKQHKKELQKKLKEKARMDFIQSLPMNQALLHNFFGYLEENLGDDCDHTMNLTIRFLRSQNIDNPVPVLDWLKSHGGYCDCEVLANIEEKFE